MARKTRVLFICTGNSARSQMAEGFARNIGGDLLDASSGGIEPKGIHSLTPKVMAEREIDITLQTSKRFHVADAATSDIVVTLCDDARDRCPILPARVTALHWSLEDPAAPAEGEEIDLFRRVRDEIEQRVGELIGKISAREKETHSEES
jgi:arsenate reductase